MAKELMGAVVRKTKIEATYRFDFMGAVKVAKKEADWPAEVLALGVALIAACDDLTPDLDDVIEVQIYTTITDPDGNPPFSDPGDVVDVAFTPNSSPRSARVGDDEVVPAEVAAARDALRTAIQAAL